jgi:hypothetical protein
LAQHWAKIHLNSSLRKENVVPLREFKRIHLMQGE